MDHICIQNKQLSCTKNKTQISEFLNAKIQKVSDATEENSEISVKPQNKKRKLMPEFSFRFGEHHIGESVQYQVELIETFKIFGKTITQKYLFKTQYSKLQRLALKLKTTNFPQKKWFGNKDSQFIQKRKKELATFLNNIAKEKSNLFYQFVLQIKQACLATEQRKIFRI